MNTDKPATEPNWKGLATFLAESMQCTFNELSALSDRIEQTRGEEDDNPATEILHHIEGTQIGCSTDFGIWFTKDGWTTDPIPGAEEDERPQVSLSVGAKNFFPLLSQVIDFADLSPGSMVVFRSKEPISPNDLQELRKRIPAHISICVLKSGESIDSLTETQLAAIGLFRAQPRTTGLTENGERIAPIRTDPPCDEYDPAGPGAGVEYDGQPQCAQCGWPKCIHPAHLSFAFPEAVKCVAAHIYRQAKSYIEIAIDPKTKEIAWTFNPTLPDIPEYEALRQIKLTALTTKDGAQGLGHIVRLCIDAGITATLPELQSAKSAPSAVKK